MAPFSPPQVALWWDHVFLLGTLSRLSPAPFSTSHSHGGGFTCPLWSLQQLKGRVLVKGKKLPARHEDGRVLSDREDEDEEEEESEEAVEAAEQSRRVSASPGLGVGKAGKAGESWSLEPGALHCGCFPRPSPSPRSSQHWLCIAVPPACGPWTPGLAHLNPATLAPSASARPGSSPGRQVGTREWVSGNRRAWNPAGLGTEWGS